MLKRGLLLFLSVSLLDACVGDVTRGTSAVAFGQMSPRAKCILDLPVVRIDIQDQTMEDALRDIEGHINTDTEYATSFGVGFSQAPTYRNQGVPEGNWKRRNPTVGLHVRSTTLCAIMNELCRQSGWSYRWFGDGLGFIDDASYFRSGKDRCYDGLELFGPWSERPKSKEGRKQKQAKGVVLEWH